MPSSCVPLVVCILKLQCYIVTTYSSSSELASDDSMSVLIWDSWVEISSSEGDGSVSDTISGAFSEEDQSEEESSESESSTGTATALRRYCKSFGASARGRPGLLGEFEDNNAFNLGFVRTVGKEAAERPDCVPGCGEARVEPISEMSGMLFRGDEPCSSERLTEELRDVGKFAYVEPLRRGRA